MGRARLCRAFSSERKKKLWNVNNEKVEKLPRGKKGMSENGKICYVIIILLHHYPFFVPSKRFRYGMGGEIALPELI
jgi:hypothetical protein